MIRSMTAFGNAKADLEQGTLALELRSVNSRFLDLYFRLPDELRHVETPLRELLTAQLARGRSRSACPSRAMPAPTCPGSTRPGSKRCPSSCRPRAESCLTSPRPAWWNCSTGLASAATTRSIPRSGAPPACRLPNRR